MGDNTSDTDPELERLTWNPQVKEDLAQHLQGKTCTILIVGPTGVGKSAFINSLVLKRACLSAARVKSVTENIKRVLINIKLGQDRTCSLTIIDSPGFIGRRRVDNDTKTQLEQFRRSDSCESMFDLLLICFDLVASGCRHSPLSQLATLRFLEGIFGEECIVQKGVIILTKGNEVKVKAVPDHTQAAHQQNPSTSRSWALTTLPVAPPCPETEVDGEAHDDLPVSVEKLLQDWKQMNQEVLEEEGYGKFAHLPVYVAGQVTFTKDGNPDKITEIDGTRIWYEKVWNGCALRSGDDSDLAALLLFIYQEIKEKVPGFKGPRVYMTTLKKIADRVAGTAAIVGTGLCIGAGIAASPLAVGLLAAGGAACLLVGGVYGIIALRNYIKEKPSKASQPTASRTECIDRTKKLN